MVINKFKFLKVSMVLMFTFPFLDQAIMADFIGPRVIVDSKVGEAPNEFNVEYDDMGSSAPSIRSVNVKGNIFFGR